MFEIVQVIKGIIQEMIMLFIAWYTAHTYSVILIPWLMCTFLYYHGIENIISSFTY